MTLIALLPVDRNQLGTLQACFDGAVAETFPCLGKADLATAARKGNPKCNPERPYGDTPTGTWRLRVGGIQRDSHAYGTHRVLLLWPLGGQGYLSYTLGGRGGIWIHGGDLNAAGGLRPTYGSIRVSNETMARLLVLIDQHGQIETLEIKEV